jgi:hypothetical protein
MALLFFYRKKFLVCRLPASALDFDALQFWVSIDIAWCSGGFYSCSVHVPFALPFFLCCLLLISFLAAICDTFHACGFTLGMRRCEDTDT